MTTTDINADASGVLILGEVVGDAPLAIVPEMIALAKQVTSGSGGPVCVLLVGDVKQATVSGLVSAGADRVYVAPSGPQNLYDSEVHPEQRAGVSRGPIQATWDNAIQQAFTIARTSATTSSGGTPHKLLLLDALAAAGKKP